jgi:PAS domain S-box-containing protein
VSVSNEAVQMMLLGDAAEHAEVGILVWNAERRYVAVNRRTCELLGVTREELLDQPVGATNREHANAGMIAELLKNVPSSGSTPFRDGTLYWTVFPTTLAGLDHVLGLMWDDPALAP